MTAYTERRHAVKSAALVQDIVARFRRDTGWTPGGVSVPTPSPQPDSFPPTASGAPILGTALSSVAARSPVSVSGRGRVPDVFALTTPALSNGVLPSAPPNQILVYLTLLLEGTSADAYTLAAWDPRQGELEVVASGTIPSSGFVSMGTAGAHVFPSGGYVLLPGQYLQLGNAGAHLMVMQGSTYTEAL